MNVAVAATTLAIARLLNSAEYGTFVQLVAVFYVLTMPGLALVIAVVRRVSEMLARADLAALERWTSHVRRRVYTLSLAGGLLGAALSYPIARLLAIHSTGGLVETFVAGVLWTVACFERALLQARNAYRPYAVNLTIEGIARCAVTLLAVAAGLGVPGAAGGLLISIPLAIVHARIEQQRLAANPAERDVSAARSIMRGRAQHDALIALLALSMLAILQNVDVLVLGRRDPASSGSYGAVSVASKSLVLIAFVLAGFLLPEAASRRAAGHHALTPLVVSLLFIAVPAGALIAISIAAGHPLLSVAFGSRLAKASAALTPLAVAMTLLAATVTFTHYLLAAGSRVVIGVLCVAAVVTTVALALAGKGPTEVAWTDAVTQGVLAVVLAGLVALHHRHSLSR